MRILILCIIYLFTSIAEAQQFDAKFLQSLPPGIAADLQKQVSSSANKAEKNIVAPETRIKNLERALSDAKRTLSEIEKDININNYDLGPLERFGESFFRSYQTTFLPVNQPNAQSSYILDYGDKVNIQLVGQRNDILKLEILRSGVVNLNEIGEINLAGLSLQSASDLVQSIVTKKFIGTEAYLTLTELRDMNVMIVGNIKNPGMYTLSGGSTILSLIDAAGGIGDRGSYREVHHKRNGQLISKVDLYDIFLDGDLSKLSQLRSGDSIVIPQSGKEIQISGGVSSPAIYEIKDDESLSDVLKISGYRSTDNSSKSLSIDRRNNGNYQKLDVDIANASQINLKDGDSIEVPFIQPIFSQTKKVIISGEVNIPGTYFIKDGTTISDLIRLAGNYTSDAYPLGGVLTRENAKNLESELKERSYSDLIRFIIATQGGGNALSLGGSISSSQLVSFLSLLREYEPSGRLVSEFELSKLESNPFEDRRLEAGDRIHIPTFRNQVYVYGEVLNPSSYSYKPGRTVKEYLNMTGGLSRSADQTRIIIIHPNGQADSVEMGVFNNLFANDNILPGSLIYVPQYVGKVDGISFAAVVAPIVSSVALSIASLNSINN